MVTVSCSQLPTEQETCVQGYGAVWAFMPATISLEGESVLSNYISNGNSKLPMVIHVQDQAGSIVTSGKAAWT